MPLRLRLGNSTTILVFRERKNELDRNEKNVNIMYSHLATGLNEQIEHELVIHESHSRRQMFCSRHGTFD